MGRVLFGVAVGLVLGPCLVLAWFQWGNPPVAVGDKPLPLEKLIVSVPMDARISREIVKTPPIQPTEKNLIAGAEIFEEQCASCHGSRGNSSYFGYEMYPKAPQLWDEDRNGKGVGVSGHPAGEIYWKVSQGIRLTGMPAFHDILTEKQIWQVSLLLANANKPLPRQAAALVSGQTPETAH